ncbi:MAG: DUF4129 domain-containing protein [Desulfobacterales bacterium]|nr:DUF4129 domain-containing protein [Desulfobacterales bacterium]
MKPKDAIFVPDALGLAERAVHLLRKQATSLADYYIGTMPFILGLLFFWADMSRNPYAELYCAPAAGGLALLFIWMKFWHARFCRRLLSALNDTAPEAWPWRRCWQTALRQAALQATGLAVLPVTAVIMLPMAWAYAFYQNGSVLDGPETVGLKPLYNDALRQAMPWPGQNHLLLTILSVFGLLVLLNLAVGTLLLPYLLKWLLGVETAFTFSGLRAMTNTTFFTIICALTYVCIDPIIKAAYTLRCFYGQSRHTGDDLRAALKPFLKTLTLFLFIGAAAVMSTSPAPALAADEDTRPTENQGHVRQLDDAIDRVLQERRFAWRLPREKQAPAAEEQEKNWLERAFDWLLEKIAALFAAVDRWMESLAEWLRRRFPDPDGIPSAGKDWRAIIRILFYGIGVLLLIVSLVLLRRWWVSRRAGPPKATARPVEARVDIRDETLTAADLPRDRWLALARELMDRQDFRHALRALYLAVLAQLGDNRRVSIARYKSNRDYLDELTRRAHAEPELLNLFTRCMLAFERAWYGMHPVAEAQLTRFMTDQERIAALVQQAA